MNDNKETKSLKDELIEVLNEKGPLYFVLLSVAFNFLIILKEFYGKEVLTLQLYFVSALIGTLAFATLLLLLSVRERKISSKYTCQILNEKDEYDLQEQGEKIKVICKQNYKIMALDKMDKFRTFYPIYGQTPLKFICEEGPSGNIYTVTSEQLVNEPNGVNLSLRRSLIKKEKEEIPPIIWEYENIPSEQAIRTAVIARPTSKLEISVSLPTNKTKPTRHGWFPVNAEGESVGRLKKTKCLKVGDRYCLYAEIKSVEVGLSYRIFWTYPR